MRSAQTSQQSSKRLKIASIKPNTSKSVNKDFKKTLTFAVVDNNHPEGTITAANWKLVELALLKVFMDVISSNPGPPPQCRDAGWFQGRIKKIACSDFRSMELYKAAISKVGEVWKGAKLNTIPLDQIPTRPRSITRLPIEPSNPREILEILQCSNTDLPTSGWRVAKVSEVKGNYREAIIILNEQSLPLIKQRNNVLSYGFGTISLRVYKADAQRVQQPQVGLQNPHDQFVSSGPVMEKMSYEDYDNAALHRSSYSMSDSETFEDFHNPEQAAYPISDDEDAAYNKPMAFDAEGHRIRLGRY